MNNDLEQGINLTTQIVELMNQQPSLNVLGVLGTPFIHLPQVAKLTASTTMLQVAAQNCHQEPSGAFTGEISCAMLKSVGVTYVIIGHSERREYFKESNELLSRKVDAALSEGLTPIFCCGEPLSIRESNDQMEYVCHQLTSSLFHLTDEQIGSLVVAYEPIWAIGTGKTASAAQAQEMHEGIRNHLASKFGQEIAGNIPILYGGSCKPGNASEIFAGPDVDGGLIGGASLNAEDFMAIINSL